MTRIARLAVLTGVALASTAQAQALDPVVVTGSRSEQRSFDAPGAIQSVSRDVIDNAGPQINLSESLNRVPA